MFRKSRIAQASLTQSVRLKYKIVVYAVAWLQRFSLRILAESIGRWSTCSRLVSLLSSADSGQILVAGESL
jgi:hypothetical protein